MKITVVVNEIILLIKRKELEKAQALIRDEIAKNYWADYRRRVRCIDEINKDIIDLKTVIQRVETLQKKITDKVEATVIMPNLELFIKVQKNKLNELRKEKRRLSRTPGGGFP